MLKDNGDTLHATDGVNEFDIKKSQVTNDLDIAAAVIKRAATQRMPPPMPPQLPRKSILQKQQAEQVEFLRMHPLDGAAPSVTPH